jgi:hypothetical protein
VVDGDTQKRYLALAQYLFERGMLDYGNIITLLLLVLYSFLLVLCLKNDETSFRVIDLYYALCVTYA